MAEDEREPEHEREGSSFVPPRPDPVEPEVEVADDVGSVPAPSGAPFWIGLALLVAFIAICVGVGAALMQPDPCDGTTFRSSRFGYCLTVPDGWTADGEATLGEIAADRIQVPDDLGTIYVQAVPMSEGQTLQDFADYIRSLNQQAGYQLGEIVPSTVGGVPAMRWDYTTGVSDGVQLTMRELVFVDDGNGWRVQIADGRSAFDRTAATVDAMLDTWVFA